MASVPKSMLKNVISTHSSLYGRRSHPRRMHLPVGDAGSTPWLGMRSKRLTLTRG